MERIQNKENFPKNPLTRAYLEIHNKEPEGLEEWQIAQGIVEVLDDPQWVPPDLAKECVYRIVHSVQYPDDKTRIGIVLMAEEKAKNIFPELAKTDEIHMDQIEYAYNKWKEKEK